MRIDLDPTIIPRYTVEPMQVFSPSLKDTGFVEHIESPGGVKRVIFESGEGFSGRISHGNLWQGGVQRVMLSLDEMITFRKDAREFVADLPEGHALHTVFNELDDEVTQAELRAQNGQPPYINKEPIYMPHGYSQNTWKHQRRLESLARIAVEALGVLTAVELSSIAKKST